MARALRAAFAGVFAAVILAGGAPAQESSQFFTGFQGKSKDPIQIDAISLEISETDTQRIAVFEGNVVVKRGDTTMTAAKMTVYSNKDTPAGGATPVAKTPAKPVKAGSKDSDPPPFTRMEASGGVRVTSGTQVITGEHAVVDMPNHTITLAGGIVLSQGTNVITGDKLIIDTTSGKARVEQVPGKQIRGIFSPSDIKTGESKQ